MKRQRRLLPGDRGITEPLKVAMKCIGCLPGLAGIGIKLFEENHVQAAFR